LRPVFPNFIFILPYRRSFVNIQPFRPQNILLFTLHIPLDKTGFFGYYIHGYMTDGICGAPQGNVTCLTPTVWAIQLRAGLSFFVV